MRKIKILALLAAMMLLPLAGGGAHAVENNDKEAFVVAQKGISELLNRYDTRATFETSRSECDAYNAWQDFAERNNSLTNPQRLVNYFFDRESGVDYWWRIPESVRKKALGAGSMYDALLTIKANSVYNEVPGIKTLVDAKLAAVEAFMADIKQVEAKAEELKQNLIKYYPERAEDISKFTYNTIIGSGSFGYVCVNISNLRGFAKVDPDKFWELNVGVFGFEPYYSNIARYLLNYDSTVLDGIELPLTSTALRALNLVQRARELPQYETFYKYYNGDISLLDLVRIFYPDAEINVPDDDADDDVYEEYFETLADLMEQIPNIEQYRKLINSVQYIEYSANGMKESSGLVMLSGSNYLVENALSQIAELTELLESVEVDNPASADDNEEVQVPTAPNTGSEGMELAGTIGKIALTGVASLAALIGAIVVAKRYVFSPLKRK